MTTSLRPFAGTSSNPSSHMNSQLWSFKDNVLIKDFCRVGTDNLVSQTFLEEIRCFLCLQTTFPENMGLFQKCNKNLKAIIFLLLFMCLNFYLSNKGTK